MSYQPIPTSIPDHRAAPNIAGFLHANTPTPPRAQPDHAAMDDTAEYSALAQVCRHTPTLGQIGGHRAMSATYEPSDPALETDDEFITIALTLGDAPVDVSYVMVSGCVLVQGAEVNGEWVDIDSFASRVSATWRRDIERKLEGEQ